MISVEQKATFLGHPINTPVAKAIYDKDKKKSLKTLKALVDRQKNVYVSIVNFVLNWKQSSLQHH